MKSRFREAGFSLVEVTLAVGALSVCLLTMIGMLPVGLDSMRKAMDQTAASQIVQRINSEALLTPFDELGNFVAASPIYFDQEGQVVPAGAIRARFKVTLTKSTLGANTYPGAAKATKLNSSLFVINALIEDGRTQSASKESSTNVIFIPNSGG